MMDQADALEDQGSQQRLALYVEAEKALGRAFQLNGTDYRVYTALARNRADEPDYPNDNDLQILRVASALAPQVQDIRVRTAQAMMAREMYEDVIFYLSPVANNPHGGEGLNEVRSLLAKAREKAGQPAVADEAAPLAEDAGIAPDAPADADAGTTAPG